jgi:hypothetical protein
MGGRPGEDRGGDRTEGVPWGAGGGGDSRPPSYSPDQIRQFRGEIRERLQEAQQLREQLRQDGIDTSELDNVIRDMRALDQDRVWAMPRDLAQLQASVVDGVKQFEYQLRRELMGADEERLLLTGADEVPEGFRKLVEEYYKALARRRN